MHQFIHTHLRMHQDYTHPLTYAPRLYTPTYVCTKIIHIHLRMHQDYTHPLTYAQRLHTPSYVYASRQHALLHMRQYNNPLTHASIQHIPFPIHMHQDDIHPLTYASTAHTKMTYTLLLLISLQFENCVGINRTCTLKQLQS